MDLRSEDAKIIVISGKARSGKDKTTVFLKEEFEKKGEKVIVLSYSKYIKDYAVNVSDWNGSEEEKPRSLLQFLGTDIIRKRIDEHFFIKRMIQDIIFYRYFFDIIIISDARLVDEIEFIKSNFNDVITVKVVRPNFVSELSYKEKEHVTETELDYYEKFDYKIINDGTLLELYDKVKEVAIKI